MKGKELLDRLYNSTVIRFGLVGVANTLFGAAIMFVLYNGFGVSYWISSACNYIFGSILSYFLNKHFTFRDKAKGWKQVLRFAVGIALCYLVAYGLAQPMVKLALGGFDLSVTLQDNIAMLAGMVLFVCFNYLTQRFFTFRKNQD